MARSVELVQPDLAPTVYEFWSSKDQRCLYVGKASRNPGDRIKSHFDLRKSWALEADVIRLHRLQHGAPGWELDMAEQTRIGQLTPRGNKEFNWAHYDAVWDLRVQREQARRARNRVPWAVTWALFRAWLKATIRRVLRAAAVVAVVDLVAAAVVVFLLR